MKKKIEEEDGYGKVSEKEVEKMLSEDMNEVKCIYCGRKISLLTCGWSDGNPVCRGECF